MSTAKLFIIVILFLSSCATMNNIYQAYQFYNLKNEKTDFNELIKVASEADVVLFGELHNNPICHWLQFELARSLSDIVKDNLIIGAEMFETDDQLVIDEYFSELVAQSNFEKETKLWKNYSTDYKPIIEFAKEKKLKFIATNIPRRYAAIVAKQGFEGLQVLSEEAKKYIAPLPIEVDLELPGYKKMEEMTGTHSFDSTSKPGPSPVAAMKGKMPDASQITTYLKQAQAVKDATMAHFILKNFSPGKVFLHLNGTYHSNNFEGIVWFLKKQNPNLKVITIASVEQDKLDSLANDNKKLADYILVIPNNMTKTY